MNYGATFKLEIFDFETGESGVIISRPSDYLQMQLWGESATGKLPKAAGELYGNYAVLWFALRRLGELEKYGLSDEKLTVDELTKLSERVSIYVSTVKDEDLPTMAQRS